MTKVFNSIRNYDNIQYASLRKDIDPKYNKAHDILSDAYYNFWKEDEAKSITIFGKTYDKLSTVELSKAQFDKIHGLLADLQQKELYDENEKLADKKDEKLKANMETKPTDKDGNDIVDSKTKIEQITSKIADLKTKDSIELDITKESVDYRLSK